MSETPNDNQPVDRQEDRVENAIRHQSEQRSKGKEPPRRKLQVPSVEQCLAALGGITGMMLSGHMNTKQAGVATRAYDIVLKHYRQPKTADASPVVEKSSLVDSARNQPSLINSLAAYLPQERIDEMVKEIQEGESEAA